VIRAVVQLSLPLLTESVPSRRSKKCCPAGTSWTTVRSQACVSTCLVFAARAGDDVDDIARHQHAHVSREAREWLSLLVQGFERLAARVEDHFLSIDLKSQLVILHPFESRTLIFSRTHPANQKENADQNSAAATHDDHP
jgi:hypothetical protein